VAVEIALAVGVVVAVGYLGLMPPAGHGWSGHGAHSGAARGPV